MRSQPRSDQRALRLSGPGSATAFLRLFAICYSLFTTSVHAFDRSNVPLKNWGGFAAHRSWIYDALEKVVLAGLTEEVLLNSKPLTRVEAARIIAQAVRRLAEDQYGDYNHRGYLEELLYRLVDEFGPELAEMGVMTPLNRDVKPGFWSLTLVDNAQFDASYANRSHRAVNNFGAKVTPGVNPHAALDGRAQIGDFLSFYYQPELFRSHENAQGRLLGGYGKLTLWNTDLEVGRDSLWWGPGYRGSMSFSNNAFPLDQVRLSSAEPLHLPWILGYLGPVKASLFVAQLDEDRDFPHAKVAGWRVGMAPSRYVELGFNRIFQFGGRGRAAVNPGNFLGLLVTQGSDNPNSTINVNNLMSFDATLRIPDAERYILIARDAAFYFDFGWDDTLFGLIVPDKPGGIVGTYLTGLFGDPKLDLRVEYTKTSDIQFTHSLYTSGFTNRGSVLSHFVGTDGTEIYSRVSRWLRPDLLLGLQVSQAVVGSPLSTLAGAPREKRNSIGVDVSYQVSSDSSIFLGYDFTRVRDRGFTARSSVNENVLRLEFTRGFGK